MYTHIASFIIHHTQKDLPKPNRWYIPNKDLVFSLVYSIPSAYVHMIWGNQYNSYNLWWPGCIVNISYNVVVNTNTVNKQANTYTHTLTYTRTQDYLCFST